MAKAWGGRFEQDMNAEVAAFNASITVDERLFFQDIIGSIRHAEMLCKTGIITEEDKQSIVNGLSSIKEDYQQGLIAFSVDYEDIHLNIEKLLIDRIGPVGGKLHTARSRNDQVATDMHLYTKQSVEQLIEAVTAFQHAVLQIAEQHIEVIMPGYTHLQRAQPVLFSHHVMTYFWMLERDKNRLLDSLKRINFSPLGSGALAGTTFPIDQYDTCHSLGFTDIYANSMDAVSDRDYILETMANLNLIMIHLSRFSEEIILWCSEEFKFITLSDQYATGSSIMPQKKNPDMAELIRGKAGIVCGHYMGLLMTMKGLPLAYNKDLQEDKKGFFAALDDTLLSVKIFTGMIQTMTVKEHRLNEVTNQDFSNATELADYLVTLNIPFREAHAITGQLVLQCIDQNRLLKDLPLDEYKKIHPKIDEDIYTVLTPAAAVARRTNPNGTSPSSVKLQIEKGKQLL